MADLPDADYAPLELSPESERCIRMILETKDVDQTGYIDRAELAECLYVMGFSPTKDDLKFIEKHFDKNNDGKLEIDELMSNIHVLNAHSVQKEDLMKAFKKFDLNHDGYIRLPELLKVLTLNENMSPQEASQLVDYLVRKYDTNHDGKFDYPEFVQMFMSEANPFVPKAKET